MPRNPKIEDWLKKHTEKLAKRCAKNLKAASPKRSGKMAGSFRAEGTEVKGVAYSLIVDKRKPFIKAAALKRR